MIRLPQYFQVRGVNQWREREREPPAIWPRIIMIIGRYSPRAGNGGWRIVGVEGEAF